MTFETLKNKVFELAFFEKIELIRCLAESISKVNSSPTWLNEEQRTEILKRQDEVLSGAVKTIPAEEVEREIKERYGLLG